MLTNSFCCYNIYTNMTRKVFRAGNSDVVTLDPRLEEKYQIALGVPVVQYDSGDGILIKPARKPGDLPADLASWLGAFEKKHATALRRLANS